MSRKLNDRSDLDSLFHPSLAFDAPADVARDPDLTLNEKRAILASWASDACAVDSSPALRRTAMGVEATFDEIVKALRTLDRQAMNDRGVVSIGARRAPQPQRQPHSLH